MQLSIRRVHLVVGMAGIVAFLGTGLYMDRVHGHLFGYDDDGSELFVHFNNIVVVSAFKMEDAPLPISITLTGRVRIGVPEVGSVIQAGLATAGMAGLVIRRRRSA